MVPPYEFELGLDRIRGAGFEVQVHPQCYKKHLFFAGTDFERAEAFLEMAMDPWSIDIIFGVHEADMGPIVFYLFLMEFLGGVTQLPPRKLLAGYSQHDRTSGICASGVGLVSASFPPCRFA